MHPASYQEETANLVEKAQVKNKTKQNKKKNAETQRVSFMAQQSLNWPPKKPRSSSLDIVVKRKETYVAKVWVLAVVVFWYVN